MSTRESGNTLVSDTLSRMVESGNVPHAILLHQEDGGEAFPLVIDFLEKLYGGSPKVRRFIHPDIHFVFPVAGEKSPVSLQFMAPFRELLLRNPRFTESQLYEALSIEGKQSNISVSEARSILECLSLSAVEGGYRSVVMYLPEKMNTAAANALLKMLEEPPAKTLFVLVTLSPEKVLTTISSRCLHLRVMPGGESAPERGESNDLFADILQAILSKDLLTAIQSADALADLKGRENQKAFCRAASEDLRRIFLLQQGLPALAGIAPEDEPFFSSVAKGLRLSFPRQALSVLDRSQLLIERNVNQKILFTDMVNQLYILQNGKF